MVAEGFKNTEIGVIPEDWVVNIIKNVAPLQRGFDLPISQIQEGNYPVVFSNGIKKYHNTFKINGPGIVTGRSGTIGNVFFVEKNFWPHNTSLFVTNFNRSTPKYIFYLYQYLDFNKYSTGSGVPTLNRNDLHNAKIPLPPLQEQIAIAEALSDADGWIANLEQQIAKKRLIKQGAMQQLLTPKEDWEEFSLFEIAEKKRDLFNDGDWIESEHIIQQGIRLIQTGNIGIGKFLNRNNHKFISEKSFKDLKCKELIENDILICRLAEPAGRVCLFPKTNDEKTITSVDVTIFRPDVLRFNRALIMYLLCTDEWFNQVLEKVGGTTHKRISRGNLGSLKIVLPKSLTEQMRIATILSDMDGEIETLENQLAKARQIKQGMMQELLTGRVRLV